MEQGDPGYRWDAYLFDIHILLDGKEVKNCITADSDAGEIVVIGDLPLPGGEFLNSGRRDEWPRWRYRGKVEIVENTTEKRL